MCNLLSELVELLELQVYSLGGISSNTTEFKFDIHHFNVYK